jgi:DNA (cytosine-5)-methyltransferase 1
VAWAIEDLVNRPLTDPLDEVAELSPENAERVAWLFANDEYDMPLRLRPDCHKEGTSYGAVYGRMRWDKPAPTLTTGFLTPGRGRFIHPKRPRTLTPREAARIQGFPDWFEFVPNGEAPAKRDLGKWIGNAVPTILGYAAGLSALGRRSSASPPG